MPYLAWPVCVCVMVVAVVGIISWRFPAQVGGLIGRVTSIGAGGVKANPPAVVSQEVKDLAKPEQAEELLRVFDNQLLVQQEDTIKETYLKNVNNPSDRERVLVRHMAWLWITFAFEMTYNSVWGSQLGALQSLNESGPKGLAEDVLNVWYEVGKTGYPTRYENYSFQSWLAYLHGNFLTTVGTDHMIRITQLGNEFLVYIIRNKYALHKDG